MDESSRPMLANQPPQDNNGGDFDDTSSESTKIHSFVGEELKYDLRNDEDYPLQWEDPPVKLRTVFTKAQTFLTWTRWFTIIALQLVMILIICIHAKRVHSDSEKDPELQGKVVEAGGDINGLYRSSSHSYSYLNFEPEKYFPNVTTNENRAEVRRNWDLLLPKGSGSIAVPQYRDHPLLGKPITDDPLRQGPIFEAAWTHAMHCLYYTVDAYHQLFLVGRSAVDDPYHAEHCFEYLRTSIMCNLDMTLEGELSTPAQMERGQPHVCKNRDEVVKWIEDRRVDDLQDIVGPTATGLKLMSDV